MNDGRIGRSRVGRNALGHRTTPDAAGQARPLEQLIPGYNRATGPAIAIPEELHRAIPTIRGSTDLTPRQILANDIWNLRAYTNAPNSSLQKLIDLNNHMYPGAYGK